jgi:hypothetical protein
MTYRGICMIRDNGAYLGRLLLLWATRGERYRKQAFCSDPDAVRDIYERVAAGQSLRSVGRAHPVPGSGKTMYPGSIAHLVRFAANHTGVIECRYGYQGRAETWAQWSPPWSTRRCGGALTASWMRT